MRVVHLSSASSSRLQPTADAVTHIWLSAAAPQRAREAYSSGSGAQRQPQTEQMRLPPLGRTNAASRRTRGKQTLYSLPV